MDIKHTLKELIDASNLCSESIIRVIKTIEKLQETILKLEDRIRFLESGDDLR